MREAVAGYRQMTLAGELAAARELLAAAGVACVMRGEEIQPPGVAETALAWAVREGVTNVIRHSRARSCAITLGERAGEVTLLIEDDGKGVDAPDAPGNGLRGLEERVAGQGGELQAGPKAGGGYRLRVALPARGGRSEGNAATLDGPVERSGTR